jgi:thioesterase domain-containing protein
VNAAALLSELRRRDIRVWAAGAELRCDAPSGALTPELREALRVHKNEILDFLASAEALASQQRAIVPLQGRGSRAPVFAVPGHNGDVFCYRALAQAMGADQPFFGLQPPGLDGEAEPLTRVEKLAACFAAQIRAFQPQGPYVIAGYCAGGTVAFELARQLQLAGAPIRFLALFGSPYPLYFRWPTQLWQGIVQQLRRIGKHARELQSQSAPGLRRYLAEELRQRRARQEAERARAQDAVLRLRAEVERATLQAVQSYAPRFFAGQVHLFLPGPRWQRSGVAASRWRSVAQSLEAHCGPAASLGHDMLREPHAAAFAELFRHCCAEREAARFSYAPAIENAL